ncbi:hypothetical protein APZ14_32800 (plasmid) [Escherichia coli]|uniref:hypothetical protein n=1 Tax=Escherichia coli TaxID=562 RepID=UPI00081161B5|nr:hypothetical protein [Escherichia coli]ODJ44742.1 hypothetical protein APZ14_32800 [Escherichia coli]
MKNNWRTLQTVLTVFIRIFIALCKNGLVMRMKAFISRPFPAAVQLNKKRNWPGIMPVHGSCFSTRGVTIASLTQRCWLFYSSSAYLISSAKK